VFYVTIQQLVERRRVAAEPVVAPSQEEPAHA